jgi:hypothetical protein
VLGGRFMQTTSASPAGDNDAVIMVTYDQAGGEFRRWFFHSTGGAIDMRGRWDEKSQTFTWQGQRPDGRTVTATDRRVDDGRREWTAVVKDASGKVVGEMRGTATRRNTDRK